MQMVAALNHLIKQDQDRIMIANLEPADGVMERIEFLSIRAGDS